MPLTITDIIILALIFAGLGAIVYFTFRNKKGKSKCHGCPYLKQCQKNKCEKEEVKSSCCK